MGKSNNTTQAINSKLRRECAAQPGCAHFACLHTHTAGMASRSHRRLSRSSKTECELTAQAGPLRKSCCAAFHALVRLSEYHTEIQVTGGSALAETTGSRAYGDGQGVLGLQAAVINRALGIDLSDAIHMH